MKTKMDVYKTITSQKDNWVMSVESKADVLRLFEEMRIEQGYEANMYRVVKSRCLMYLYENDKNDERALVCTYWAVPHKG